MGTINMIIMDEISDKINKLEEVKRDIMNAILIRASNTQLRRFCIDMGICPDCASNLENKTFGEEDEYSYLVCPKNISHVKRYIGLAEDL
jgi:hypothetical protein